MKSLLATIITLAALASPAQANDPDFSFNANALCRDIINARDYQTFSQGKSDSLDLFLGKLQRHDPPGMDDRQHLATLLDAMHKELVATQDRLLSLAEDHPQHTEDLALFAQAADSYTTLFATRSAALRAPGPLDFPSESQVYAPRPDQGAWEAATVRLGFARHDCERVFFSNGNPPGLADFIGAIAPVCAAVDREFTARLDELRETAMAGYVDVFKKKMPQPEAAEAYQILATAWTQTASSLHDIKATGDIDPSKLSAALEQIGQRAQLFAARANAIASNDLAFISEVFGRRTDMPDFRSFGLEETTCPAVFERL